MDTKPQVNTPQNIDTLQTLDAVLKQVQQNNQDLPAAISANQVDGLPENQRDAAIVSSILGLSIVSKPAPTQTPAVDLSGQNGAASKASATATANPAATQTTNPGRGRKGSAGKGTNNGNTNGQANPNANRNGAKVKKNEGKQGGPRLLRWAKRG